MARELASAHPYIGGVLGRLRTGALAPGVLKLYSGDLYATLSEALRATRAVLRRVSVYKLRKVLRTVIEVHTTTNPAVAGFFSRPYPRLNIQLSLFNLLNCHRSRIGPDSGHFKTDLLRP